MKRLIFNILFCLFATTYWGQVAEAEYFFDTDPGQGAATALVALDGMFDTELEQITNNNATYNLLSQGLHTLSIRVKDNAGNWGPLFSTVLQKGNATPASGSLQVTQAEYFFDTDPGQGAATALFALDGTFDTELEQITNNNATYNLLSQGLHTLSMRVRDNAGNWGPLFSTVIQKGNATPASGSLQVTQVEYFFDTDPGQGAGTALFALDGTFDTELEQITNNNATYNLLSQGLHTLSMRVRDNAGNWGPLFSTVIQKGNATPASGSLQVTHAEYFFDTDPGQGAATALFALDGTFDTELEQITNNNATYNLLSQGLHTLSMRVRDNAGNWGPLFSTVIKKGNATPTSGSLKVMQAEYFFDADPGYGAATPLFALDGTFDSELEQITNNGALPNQITQGLHSLHIRVKDNAGNWGPDFVTVISSGIDIDNITVGLASGDTLMCANTLTNSYTASAVNGGTYSWKVTNGTINSGQNTDSVNVTWSSFPAQLELKVCKNGQCDSTLYSIDTLATVTHTLTETICFGGNYAFGGQVLTTAGTYKDTLVSSVGCDSIVTLSLSVLPQITGTDTQTACGSYTWIDGVTYTTNNTTATHTLTGANGCDSIVTLNLTISNAVTGTDTQSVCGSYTWIDGVTYTASNTTATHTLQSANGCDSIVTLNLTISNAVTGTDTQSACGSYTWIDGVTYTASNTTATHTLQSANGCDSIVTLNLTISNAVTGTDTQSACGSYTWIDGNTYTANNSTATHTLQSTNGCDSVVTLNLTISNAVSGTDTQVACGNYTWIDGVTYTASNTTATHTLQSVNGCDSVVTLNLTISNTITGTDVQSACGSYIWIDGNTYTANNSTATHTLQSAGGCDSVVTLNLTIHPETSENITEEICDGEFYILGTQTLTTSGHYSETFQSQNGCDSTVNVTLIVKARPTISIAYNNGDLTSTQGDSYQWFLDGDTIVGATSQIYSPTQNGVYTVEVVAFNGCSNSNNFTVNNVSIDEVDQAVASIHPNPNRGIFSVETSMASSVRVYNISGSLIWNDINHLKERVINIEDEAPGVYIINLEFENGERIFYRLIKK